MRHFLKISAIFFLLIYSSCITTHSGSFQSPSFSIKNNFKIVSTIEGNSNATYIFGIGGNLREGLVSEAKKNMYSKYSIQSNQNLTNITTDIKVTYFIVPLLYISQNVIVSADVIQFYDNSSELNLVDKKVVELNNVEISTPNLDSNIVDNIIKRSKEEILLDSLKKSGNNTLMKYNNISDVRTGDIVLFEVMNNEKIYGIVVEIGNNNKVKMKTYPSPGQELIIENRYSWFKKIVY
jgi:hypothetical protein